MKEAPCRDCPRKGCGSYHSECPEYQAFQKERAEVRDWLRKENDRTLPMDGSTLKWQKGIGHYMPRRRKK